MRKKFDLTITLDFFST